MATEIAPEAAEKQQEAQVPAPAPAATAPIVAAEVVTKSQHVEPLASVAMSEHDKLEAMLADPNWQPVKPAPASTPETSAAKPEQTQAQTASESIAAVPEEAAETPPEPETPVVVDPNALPQGIARPHFADETDQIIAALYKKAQREGNPISWAEAETRVKGAPQATPPEAEAASDPLATLQASLTEINAKLKEAAGRGDLYGEEIDTLNLQRAELIAEIKTEQKLAARDARHALDHSQSQQQIAVAKAKEEFPSLGTSGSPLNVRANALLAELEGSKILQKASAPIDVAKLAATQLAQETAQQNGTSFDVEFAKLTGKPVPVSAQKPPASAQPPTVARKVVTPAPGNQATRTPDKPLTESEKFSAASTVSNPVDQYKALEAALYS